MTNSSYNTQDEIIEGMQGMRHIPSILVETEMLP